MSTVINGGSVTASTEVSANGENLTEKAEETAISGMLDTDNFLHIQDRSAAASGEAIAGVQTRDLNTELINNITGASLLSNQVTLPAGTYYIEGSAPAFKVDRHRLFLRNITDTSYAIEGLHGYTENTNGVQTRLSLAEVITIASEKVFELQHYTQTATPGNNQGLGITSGIGTLNIYAELKIWKVG